MESRLKVLGHPVHPMLIVLPVGLLPIAVLSDVVYLVNGDDVFAQVAFWNILLGLIGGVAAAAFGFFDWLGIAGGTRAKRVGLVHGLGNAGVLLLFAGSLWLRIPDPAYSPEALPFLLALLGLGIALGTAWLGGELVYRLRVGVDDDADLDASSSLGQGFVSQGAPPPRRTEAEATVRR